MQDNEPTPESLLLTEDFDAIKSAIFKKIKSPQKVAKWSAWQLKKSHSDGGSLNPVAAKLLVLLATPPFGTQKVPPLEEKSIALSEVQWISRILPYEDELVGSHCLFSLYKVNVLPPKFLVKIPSTFASFARCFTVHEFMNIRHQDLKGRSIVYLFLQFQRDTKHAVEGLQKLFEVYREDFKYIISPCLSEIRLLVGEFTGHHNQIINLLQKSKSAENACLCLYKPMLIESIAWHVIKGRKPEKLTGIQQIVHDMSKKVYTETAKGDPKQKFEFVLNQIQWYLEQAYKIIVKQKSTLSAFVLPSGFTSSSVFPLHLLPMEITEIILSAFDNDETVRALFCLSKNWIQIKRTFDWRRFLKLQFPLKYQEVNSTLAENHKFKWNHYCSVQNKLRANWSQNLFSTFDLPGSPIALDENIFVGLVKDTSQPVDSNDFLFFAPNSEDGSFEMTPEHRGYYWLNWADSKDCYNVHFFAFPGSVPQASAIVDSGSDVPTLVLVDSPYTFSVWHGAQKMAEVRTLSLNSMRRRTVYHKGSLFIESYEYCLENLSSAKLLTPLEYVMEIGPTNDVMICGKPKSPIVLRARGDLQVIANFGAQDTYDTAAFLDDHLFAVHGSETICLGDLRKLDSAVLEIDLSKCHNSKVTLDAANQRAVSCSGKNSVVNVWQLKTGKWLTALNADVLMSSHPFINSRYLCAEFDYGSTHVLDFNNNSPGY